MLKKPSTIAEVLDANHNREYSQQQINKTLLIWGAVHVTCLVATTIAVKWATKKFDLGD